MTLVFRSTRYPTSPGEREGGRWTRGETPCFWSCPGRACVCRFDSVFFCRRDRLGVLSLVSLLGRPRRSQSVRCPSHGTTYSVHIGDFLRSVSEARCFLFVYSEPVGRRLPCRGSEEHSLIITPSSVLDGQGARTTRQEEIGLREREVTLIVGEGSRRVCPWSGPGACFKFKEEFEGES
ncbi:hypothetical protein Naga_100012g49 [Nannochloropsis gaditana]|uniref:Uncharacterized protein n=1 Tax=Nannochloropsis gaditana TaxID=72520 RepID=W7TDJ6_9STRA|nr:hypothetical protein Naga_100012g49 [Nannochloropsis gaditana]